MRRENLSHAYIVASPSEEERNGRARRMAAAIVCSNAGERPCGLCRHCRKAASDIHPDVITVQKETDDKGKQRREIYVGQIRNIIADAQVLPNEAEKKVYIIRDAGDMNVPAQNAMLKILEEPPAAAVFILCTDNAGSLLDTVRSRCVELSLNNDAPAADEETAALAREYLSLAASGNMPQLLGFCMANEGMDNSQAREFVFCAGQLLTDMLCGREQDLGFSRGDIIAMAELMKKAENYLNMNVGVKHVFGMLAVSGIARESDKRR
ncbi:MAG TPA: hypothetical protein GXZ52_00100 [Clostridiales bacterium]|jgi:DNA polymerase-3 subunit delta'|nr:hypothetical protein [Clostridiales bacterium]